MRCRSSTPAFVGAGVGASGTNGAPSEEEHVNSHNHTARPVNSHYPDGLTEPVIDRLITEAASHTTYTPAPSSALLDGSAAVARRSG